MSQNPDNYASEYETFEHTLRTVLSVSHEEIKRREEAYKREADRNPNKRGPKRKDIMRPSASPDVA
jgi:hypothetical protein